MNWFEKFIHTLQYRVEEPPLFGWFHFTAMGIIALLVALVIIFRRKISRRFIDNTLLAVGIFLIVIEVLKQCVQSLDVVDGLAEWDYSWRNFPFQFCSVPMYLYVIAGIFRKGKVNETILCFLATFALFGGAAVCIYPSTVLSSKLFLSIHTMIWHGSMLIIAVMLLVTNTVPLTFKSVLKALIVFVAVVIVAQAMNFAWHFWGNPDKTFSMMYISPYYSCDIPVLHDIKEKVPYLVFLLCYIIGFAKAASLVMGAAIGINKLYKLAFRKKAEN